MHPNRCRCSSRGGSLPAPLRLGRPRVCWSLLRHMSATLLPPAFVWLSARNRESPFGTQSYFFPPPALSCHIVAVYHGGVSPTLNPLGSSEICLTTGWPLEPTSQVYFLYFLFNPLCPSITVTHCLQKNWMPPGMNSFVETSGSTINLQMLWW